MLTLKLNLLSPQKKTKVSSLVRFLFTKEILEFVIFTCALLATIHLAGWLILTNTVNDLVASTLLINREAPGHSQEVKRINKIIKDFNASARDFLPLSPRLLEIIKALPPDIKINSLIISRSSQSFVLSGVAETRDSLLRYQKVIQSIPWIEGVANPTSLLFQKDNVSFDIKARLKNLPAAR